MQANYKNLFIAKLPRHVQDTDLSDIFAAHKPVSATVMLDAVTGRSKGFGFVLFETAEAGKAAEQALNKQPVSVGGQVFDLTIFPSKHVGTIAAEECECLFIRNIPNTWSMAEVDAFIARHGTPVYSAVRSDHHGSPVWVVFVEYDCVECARNTLRNIHGQRVGGDNHPAILAKFAESEEVKRNRRDRRTETGDVNPRAATSHHAQPKGQKGSSSRKANNKTSTPAQEPSSTFTPEAQKSAWGKSRKHAGGPHLKWSVKSQQSSRSSGGGISDGEVMDDFDYSQMDYMYTPVQGAAFRYNPYSLTDPIVVVLSSPSKTPTSERQNF